MMDFIKRWGGRSAEADSAIRAQRALLPGLPYATHSGPNFSAHVNGEFNETYVEGKQSKLSFDGWMSVGSPSFGSDPIAVVSASKAHRSYRNHMNIPREGRTNGWLRISVELRPDARGGAVLDLPQSIADEYIGYHQFFYKEDVFRVRPGQRTPSYQYTEDRYFGSLETYMGGSTITGFTRLLSRVPQLVIYTSEHWAYPYGDYFRNIPLLTARILYEGEWVPIAIPQPTFQFEGADVGAFKITLLSPTTLVGVAFEHPTLPLRVYKLQLGDSGWVRSPGTISGIEAMFYAEPCAYPYAEMVPHLPNETPIGRRNSWVGQDYIYTRIAGFGSQGVEVYPVDSDHILVATSQYPTTPFDYPYGVAHRCALSAAVVNVTSGQVVGPVFTHEQGRVEGLQWTYHSHGRFDFEMSVRLLGKHTWYLEVFGKPNAPAWDNTSIPVVMTGVVTRDRGQTYTQVSGNLPPGYLAQSMFPIIPFTEDHDNDPNEKYMIGCCVRHADGVRIAVTEDFVTWEIKGLVAPAARVNDYYDFLSVVRVGTREDPGYDSVFPWTVDSRVRPPDWW